MRAEPPARRMPMLSEQIRFTLSAYFSMSLCYAMALQHAIKQPIDIKFLVFQVLVLLIHPHTPLPVRPSQHNTTDSLSHCFSMLHSLSHSSSP